jgi:hypothetical protein
MSRRKEHDEVHAAARPSEVVFGFRTIAGGGAPLAILDRGLVGMSVDRLYGFGRFKALGRMVLS